MSQADREIIELIDAQIRQDEVKKRQWIIQELALISVDMGYFPSDAEINRIVELALQFMNEQQKRGVITVDEDILRDALSTQQKGGI